MAGLYIVIDAFSNLDEFLGYGRVAVVAEYYSARLPWFFDRASGLLALLAAMFAVTWLQRTNEMTALMAAGVTTRRIIRPLLMAAVFVSLLAAANRELLIPAVRDKLVRNAQDWLGDAPRSVDSVRDNRTDILIGGRAAYVRNTKDGREQRIEEARFILDRRLGGFGRTLEAEIAVYRAPDESRPGGYLLSAVSEPQNIGELASVIIEGQPVILAPSDTDWLSADQCFVVSDVTYTHLVGGQRWREYASAAELVRGLRNPSLDFGLQTRVTMHSRFVQPFLDMSLFLLGLPLVLTKQNRSVFVAVGLGVVVVIAYFGILFCCQGMGASGFLLTPAQAAWCPLIILAPAAAALSQPLWD
jgi:lipopolysaccharide export system permease protein